MKITLVRHGQTEQNYLDCIQGHENNLMNDTGRRQCQKLKYILKDKHYDFCYMSPLLRTVETAIILVGDRVETAPDKRLIERNMGELEGKSRDLYDPKKYWNYNKNCSDLGIEPVQDIFKRCDNFLSYIKEKHEGQSILIVTHAAPFRALRHLLLKTNLYDNLLDINISNCYYEEFEI